MRKIFLILLVTILSVNIMWAQSGNEQKANTSRTDEIIGNSTLSCCQVGSYEISNAIWYNSIPNNATIEWEVSENLRIVSDRNAPQVDVCAVGPGTGYVTVNFYVEEYTFAVYTTTKNVSITSNYSSYYSNYSYSSTTPLTLPANSVIAGTFTIESGAKVNITSTVYCYEDAKFVIQPGGKLVINNGTITNLCSNKMWDGIYVIGNKTLPQTPTTNQGYLEIKNHSLIENARGAIHNWDGSDDNTTGGIVIASNSSFINNESAALFEPYDNIDNGVQSDEKSQFSSCTFMIDDQNMIASDNIVFATINGIKGIYFKTCEFRDDRTSIPNAFTKGILSYNSDIKVRGRCDNSIPVLYNECDCPIFNGTTFSRLGRGIYAQGGTLTVNKVIFDKCHRSIDARTVNLTVTQSKFNLTSCDIFEGNTDVIGIYFASCWTFVMEENDFFSNYTLDGHGERVIGVMCWSSSNNTNTIYRNKFRSLDSGIVLYQDNGGLQIQCNEFSALWNGDDISACGTIPAQGSPSKSAGNKFSPERLNIYNGTANQITYYLSGANTSGNPYFPAHLYSAGGGTIVRIPGATANPCTSTICTPPTPNPFPGVIKGKSTTINDDISLYNELQQAYEPRLAEYKAAGYDFLLKNFNKEDDDIVVKAERMQDTLATISLTMSEIAKRNINAIYQDTLVFDREALNGWYNRINTIGAKYSLVNSYFETGEYDLARQELASIPQRFALDENESAEYDNFCQFNSLRESVFKSGRNYKQLTEEEIAELQEIAEQNAGISSTSASSILCFFYGICHDEEPEIDYDMDNTPNAPAALEEETIDAKSIAIYVYPNPAENELNVLFNDMPDGKNTIELLDVTGRLMLSQEITSTNARIDISSLTQGVYMYRIVNGENVIVRDRIVKE